MVASFATENQGISSDIADGLFSTPAIFKLEQNYPNPFNPSTTIPFSLPQDNKVTLDIYDVLGRRIAKLVSLNLPGGRHKFQWDATNHSSGVCYYKLSAGKNTEVRKMLLLKLVSDALAQVRTSTGTASCTDYNHYRSIMIGRNNVGGTCIGVLGAGPFANHFIPLFKAHSLVEDVYLAERMKERRETEAEKFGITKTFDDYEKLLKGDVGVSL